MSHILERVFGLLFSPGAGLFMYSPILFACFVGFFDFYKKNKFDCILMSSFVVIYCMWSMELHSAPGLVSMDGALDTFYQ